VAGNHNRVDIVEVMIDTPDIDFNLIDSELTPMVRSDLVLCCVWPRLVFLYSIYFPLFFFLISSFYLLSFVSCVSFVLSLLSFSSDLI
jgi:hypothetical protein